MRKMDFGNKWWTQDWLQVLENEDPARMARGKAYARQGKVVELKIANSKVSALVKGNSAQPYQVQFVFAPLEPSARQRLQFAMRQAGAVPEPLLHWESALREDGLSMIPGPYAMSADCSCPDWSWPCKHAAAVACLLSVRMERDPWLILELQGLQPEHEAALNEEPLIWSEELPLEAHLFWGKGLEKALNLELGARQWKLLDELGSLGDGLSRRKLKQSLEPVYEKAAMTGARWLSELLHAQDEDSEWLNALPPDEQ